MDQEQSYYELQKTHRFMQHLAIRVSWYKTTAIIENLYQSTIHVVDVINFDVVDTIRLQADTILLKTYPSVAQ